jgi:surface antigen
MEALFMNLIKPLFLLCTSSLLMGCHNLQYMGEQQRVGTVIGAVGGGIIGGTFGHGAGHLVGAAVGATLGGIAGNVIGQSFDDADARAIDHGYLTASRVPVGQTVCWSNTCTNRYGSFTPVRDGYHTDYGYYCREYASSSYFYGSRQTVYGVACRHPNGNWYQY